MISISLTYLGQSPVILGNKVPFRTQGHTFFLDTLQHSVWHTHNNRKWIKLSNVGVFLSYEYCLGYIHWLDKERKGFCCSNLGQSRSYFYQFYCGESITIHWDSSRVVARGTDHGIIANVLDPNHTCRPALIPDSVHGQPGFCLPANDGPFYKEQAEDLRTWGFLSTKGTWLIEPKIDSMLKFAYGRAKVNYQGKEHQVNENGDFVK